MDKLRIGIVGLGKIARDQHVPAIRGNDAFALVGSADPAAEVNGVSSYRTLDDMLREARLDAIAVCTPPQVRHEIARAALDAGLHVLLEKPPCATVGEVEDLADCAARAGTSLYTAWHSQHAPAIGAARRWIAEHPPKRIAVAWREDVNRWHPGQEWIWEPGGLGVFDPGINALSILTAILPRALYVRKARLQYPANRAAPIAADLVMADCDGLDVTAGFDWRQTGPQTWDITVEAHDGETMVLSMGGSRISTQSEPTGDALDGEYPGIYRRFASLIADGKSEVHAAPLRLVADAFLMADHVAVEPFVEASAQR